MAAAFVKSVSGQNTGAVTLVLPAFTGSVTAGNLIVVHAGRHNTAGSTLSVSDNKGNSYSMAVGPTTLGNGRAYIFYSVVDTGGTNFIITITASASSIHTAAAAEYSGVATSTPLDQIAAATGNGTAASSGATPTTTQANELIMGMVYSPPNVPTISAGATFTFRVNRVNNSRGSILLEDKNVTSTGTQTATGTISATNDWIAQCATFKEAGAAVVFPQEPAVIRQAVGRSFSW